MTGNVLILGLVSFFTDVSSEMIYPLLPVFLTTTLGAGPAVLGLIEGVAESTASLLKLLSGLWADRVRDRSKLVLFGYGLSSLSRPLVAAASRASHVLAVRFADRIGKGIRTAPRDALIADSVDPALRGKAFGFHRSMDHAGAVVGPLLATGLLAWCVTDIRTLFWLASVPGVVAFLLVLSRVREVAPGIRPPPEHRTMLSSTPRGPLRRYLIVVFLFTLGNSSDAFLLLRASQLGIAAAGLPLLWVFFHVVKTVATMPFGALSDTVGRRGVILAGWTVYAMSYFGFAAARTPLQVWGLFGLYGIYYGLTEGVERALIVDLAGHAARGAALGWYNCVIGIGALPASLLFGLIWQRFGPQTAFSTGAVMGAASAGLLLLLVKPKPSV